MKTLMMAAAISLLMAGTAIAGDPKHGGQQPNGPTYNMPSAQANAAAAAAARSNATANGGNATGGSQSQTVNNNVNGGGNDGWNGGNFPAASAYAPSFAVGDKCQEAISGGVSSWLAGGSAGRVYTLGFCKTFMKADYFRKQGREDMAKLAECDDPEFRRLYKGTTTPCWQDQPKAPTQTSAAPAPVAIQQASAPAYRTTGQCIAAKGVTASECQGLPAN